jgi:hypothetical protein
LAVTPGGEIAIADAVRGQVFRVRLNGQWLDPMGRPGREAGEFVRAKQVASSSQELILVTDAGRQSMLVFDRHGRGRFVMEVHEQADKWRGWTLPAGVVALDPADVPTLCGRLSERGLPIPDGFVVVSDSLGFDSLTLLGVVVRSREEATNGG